MLQIMLKWILNSLCNITRVQHLPAFKIEMQSNLWEDHQSAAHTFIALCSNFLLYLLSYSNNWIHSAILNFSLHDHRVIRSLLCLQANHWTFLWLLLLWAFLMNKSLNVVCMNILPVNFLRHCQSKCSIHIFFRHSYWKIIVYLFLKTLKHI
jgi:uncharacterized membrane protein